MEFVSHSRQCNDGLYIHDFYIFIAILVKCPSERVHNQRHLRALMETAFHPWGCYETGPRQHLLCVLGWLESELLDHLCGKALHLHHAVNLNQYYTTCEGEVERTQTAIQCSFEHHRLRTSLATDSSREKVLTE